MLNKLMLSVAAAIGLSAGPSAVAQDFPSHPIRFIVPYPPGGGTDLAARLVGQSIQASTGQSVIIENKPGGNEIIGTQTLAKAPPDGYTIALVSSTFAGNPALQAKLPYDPLKDFAAVSYLVSTPLLLFVPAASPVRSVEDLVKLAKAKPGKLSYASLGPSSQQAIMTEWFKYQAGADITQVPYRGVSPAMVALTTGEVDVGFASIASANALMQAGKIRPIAVSSATRVDSLPSVPTIAATYPGFDVTPWYGVVAPAGTPAPIIAALSREISKALQSPEVRDKLAQQGLYPQLKSSGEFQALLVKEIGLWATMAKAAGMKPE